MATYTFTPTSKTEVVDWSNPAIWSTGQVPNDAAATVIIPEILSVSPPGIPYVSDIYVTGSYTVGNLSIAFNDLTDQGALQVNQILNIGPYAAINVGGALQAASINNSGSISINSGSNFQTSLLTNNAGATLASNGALAIETLINNGSVSSPYIFANELFNSGAINSGNGSVINVTGGGFANFFRGGLTGGSYVAEGYSYATVSDPIPPQNLYFNIGGVIKTLAAQVTLTEGDMIYSFDSSTSHWVPLTSSLNIVSAGGSLTLDYTGYQFGNLEVAGTLN